MDLGEEKGQKRPRSPGNGEGVAEIYQQAMMSSLSETPVDSILVQEGGEGKEEMIDEHNVHGEGEGEEDDDEDDIIDYGSKNRVMNMAHVSNDDGREDCIDRLPLEINESRSFGPLLYTYRPDVESLLKPAPLFYVISVKIRNGAGKYLFGKIMSEDHRSVVYVYNRESSDCEYLGKEAFATLTGPYRALQVYENVCIVLNISVRESKEQHSKVEEVGRGIITWNYVRIRPGVFTDIVPGQCGSTEVTYTIIQNGVEALVGVRMIGRSIKNLHAKVVASTGRLKKKEIVLFNGTLDDAEESIRLSRSVLAVPFGRGSMLKIDVILGPDKTSHPAFFRPMKHSDEVQKPNCDYGTLEVKVQWSCVLCTT